MFVHGCFWHRHDCGRATVPATNVRYWAAKFDRNVRRDARNAAELRKLGWRCVRIWECETKDAKKLAGVLRRKVAAKTPRGDFTARLGGGRRSAARAPQRVVLGTSRRELQGVQRPSFQIEGIHEEQSIAVGLDAELPDRRGIQSPQGMDNRMASFEAAVDRALLKAWQAAARPGPAVSQRPGPHRRCRLSEIMRLCGPTPQLRMGIEVAVEAARYAGVDHSAQIRERKSPIQKRMIAPVLILLDAHVA